MKLNKFTPRRYPCPGRCGRMIWHGHSVKTFTFQKTVNLCRKCARRKLLAAAKLQRRQEPVTEPVPENA
jgi:hypothetical protein